MKIELNDTDITDIPIVLILLWGGFIIMIVSIILWIIHVIR